MKLRLACVLTMACAALVAASPVLAHHFFPRASDKPVVIVGTVTKFEMRNPHSYLHVEARDTSGNVTSWRIELGSVAALMRRGWQGDSLKAGDAITVNAIIGANSSDLAAARDITFPDGRMVFAGSHIGDTRDP
jgi:hypothetical protein